MKKVFFVAGLLIAGVISAQAQGGGGRQFANQTPDQRASRMTDMMSKQIDGLNSDQVDKIKTINLTYMQGADSLRTDKTTDRKARRDKMKALTDARDSQLKTVLTDKQFKQWQDDMAKFRNQRRNQMDRRQNNDGGDNGGSDNGGGNGNG